MPAVPAELLRRRAQLCRLTPDRALETFDEAVAFLLERGMLTLNPDCALPSLFGACHEEPAKPGSRGFGQWPKTKWPWAGRLSSRPGVQVLKLHRGRDLYLSERVAAIAAALCLSELERAEHSRTDAAARRLLRHLAAAGPSSVDDLKVELGLDTRSLRSLREPLERVGAIVSRGVTIDTADGGHRHSSELLRFDQLGLRADAPGGLAELVVAGVHAAVVAPEAEVRRWFSWPVAPALLDRLVADGRLDRPTAGWLSASA